MAADTAPRYRLHQRLGEGGMGVVHLGTMTSAAGERLVAVKRLAGRRDFDEAARARLVAEARLVFQLTYANICQVIDLGENEDGTFVVMEYVRGDDLQGLLDKLEERGQRLEPAVAIHVAREVARALDYAHRRSVVHGDVKPHNILLSVEGEVKLADFGIARALGTAAPGTGIVAGTPGFMAPEVTGGVLDHRADIYSLGATLLRALVGRRDGAPSPAELDGCAGVSPELHAIVARALAAERGARWLSAGEMERALAVEQARRHPEFTPSALAQVVVRHMRESRPLQAETTPSDSTEVFSMHTLFEHEGVSREMAEERPRTATAEPSRPRRWSWAVLPALGAAIVGAQYWPSPPMSAAVPDAGVVAVVERPVDAGVIVLPPDAAPPTPRPRRAARDKPAAPVEVGYLTVNATPWGAVFIDGRRVADETPLYRFALPAGRHEVVVEFGDGRRAPAQTIEIGAHQQHTLGFRR